MALFTFGVTPELTDTSPYTLIPYIAAGNKTIRIDRAGNWRCVLNRAFSYISIRDGKSVERQVVRIRVEQDATGGRTIGFSPGSITWKAGSPPTVPTAANAFLIVRLTWLGGTHGYVGEVI